MQVVFKINKIIYKDKKRNFLYEKISKNICKFSDLNCVHIHANLILKCYFLTYVSKYDFSFMQLNKLFKYSTTIISTKEADKH